MNFSGSCIDNNAVVPVASNEILAFFLSLLLCLLLAICEPSHGQDHEEETATDRLNNIQSIMENARKDGEKMNLPVNKHQAHGLTKAQQTAAAFHSPAFQKRVEAEQQRLAKGVFKTYTDPWQKEKDVMQEPAAILSDKEKIYLFLSSSVPIETIHSYLATIASVGGSNVIPVMFGLVKGLANIQSSNDFFGRILKEDPACRDQMNPQKLCQRFQLEIRVNPNLFSKYGITQVPAVVYENETGTFVIEGDAGFTYLLERINREAQSPSLAGFIKKIQSTN